MNKKTATVSNAVKKRSRSNTGIAWLFNAPYLVYSLVFLLLPLCWALWLSLTDWNLMSPDYNFIKLSKVIIR